MPECIQVCAKYKHNKNIFSKSFNLIKEIYTTILRIKQKKFPEESRCYHVHGSSDAILFRMQRIHPVTTGLNRPLLGEISFFAIVKTMSCFVPLFCLVHADYYCTGLGTKLVFNNMYKYRHPAYIRFTAGYRPPHSRFPDDVICH